MAVTASPDRSDPWAAHARPGSPAPTSTRRPKWLAPAAVGLVVGLGTAYTAWQDPNGDGVFPVCPTYSVFGIDCPGCGGLRATHAYTQGDVLGAFDHNVLIATLLPVAFVAWAVWMYRSAVGRPTRWPRVPAGMPWAILAVGAVFTIVRNISGVGVFEYLAATA